MKQILLSTIAIICVSIVTSARADTIGSAAADCFARLEKETIVGDSLTVFTNDGVIIRGNHPIFNVRSSLLYMKLSGDTTATKDALIPIHRIDRITYVKPSSKGRVVTCLGLVVGAVAGGLAGSALVPESEGGWLDFSKPAGIWFGGLFGGLIGAAFGHKLGKNITAEATIECR